jgi:hypothetical protein
MLADLEPKIEVQVDQDDSEAITFRLTVHCVHGAATDVWARWMIHFSASQYCHEGFDLLGQAKVMRVGETIQYEINIAPESRLLIPLELPQDIDVDVWVGFKTLWGATRWAKASWFSWPMPP